MGVLDKRYTCYYPNGDSYYSRFRCNGTTWNSRGRWILLGVAIFIIFVAFFAIACLNARKRRRMGRNPYYGTGWIPAGPGNHSQPPHQQNNPNTYYAYNQPQSAPAPPYSREPQTTGVELSRPAETFAPPQGPPPGKMGY